MLNSANLTKHEVITNKGIDYYWIEDHGAMCIVISPDKNNEKCYAAIGRGNISDEIWKQMINAALKE